MIPVKILNNSNFVFPGYATSGSAGFDICISEDVSIRPRTTILAPTGLKMIIPEGYEGQLRLRSSMSKLGLIIPNSPGTIDSDYRGEVKIALRNLQPWDSIDLKAGTRVAQIIISEIPKIHFEFLDEEEFQTFSQTERGDGGFGSTNLNSQNVEL